jgi:uncharacterized membrane protein YqgA involved in biofilm formation
MLGPTVNALVIVICSLIGCFLIRGIPFRFEELIKKSAGLCTIYLGIRGAMDCNHILLLIMSIVIGAVIGEFINIDKWMNRLGLWAERRLGKVTGAGNDSAGDNPAAGNTCFGNGETGGNKKSFSKGFVTASILYCTGSMAIVGSMQSGLQGNHEILFTKSVLDGSMSIVFGASLGIGVAFSALPVLIYQGGIALAAIAIKNLLTQDIIREMSAVGNLLVAAIGFNFIVPESSVHREIKVANLIPAIFIPWLYFTLASAFGF